MKAFRWKYALFCVRRCITDLDKLSPLLIHFIIDEMPHHSRDDANRCHYDAEIQPYHSCGSSKLPVKLLQFQHTFHHRIIRCSKAINDRENQACQKHGTDKRQYNFPEIFPAGRPFDLSSLPCMRGNCLQCCKKKQDLDASIPDNTRQIVRNGFNSSLYSIAHTINSQKLKQLSNQVNRKQCGKLPCAADTACVNVAFDNVVNRTCCNNNRQKKDGTHNPSPLEFLVQDHSYK